MFKEGYNVTFNGMGYQIKRILEEEGITAPKGFFEKEEFYEMFQVVDDSDKFGVGIWFADIEEGKFLDVEGNLVDEAPDVLWVNREDVNIWA